MKQKNMKEDPIGSSEEPIEPPQPGDYILPHIYAMSAYQPGQQLRGKGTIKLNTNESPWPLFKSARKAIKRALKQDQLHLYPEPLSRRLRQAIARRYGLGEEHVLIGNGSDEILAMLMRSLMAAGDTVVMPQPTYSLYRVLASQAAARVVEVELKENWHIDFAALQRALGEQERVKLAIIANPNAPTGIAEAPKRLLQFARQNRALTLVDEAYGAFSEASIAPSLLKSAYRRLLVTGTFSKSHALAGLRVGWLLAHPDIIAQLDKVRDSYNVGRLGQVAALAALEDENELKRRVRKIKRNRSYLQTELQKRGFQTLPSRANFLFASPPEAAGSAQNYQQFLERAGILIRRFPEGRCSHYARISIGRRRELKKLIARTDDWIEKNHK